MTVDAAGQAAPSKYTFDTDILMLRNSIDPDFRHHYDDWTQYAPAAVMVGLKTCGYKGRSTWGRMLVSDAFSVAAMAAMVNGVKYSVQRLRPDESAYNSFPSGHTATAFMTATMLHKEYEGRSPWFSIGGYTLATLTGVSRVLNNRHWLTDVLAGAAIGIGSVHLGYFITDKIFKDKQLNPAYEAPVFSYDPDLKHYVASLYFGRRFIIGEGRDYFTDGTVIRGGSAGLSTYIPLHPGVGITARIGANSLTYSTGITGCSYDILAGGYYNWHFGKRFEAQAKAMAGAAWTAERIGVDICAGIGFGFLLDENFKINIFADYDAIGSAKGKSYVVEYLFTVNGFGNSVNSQNFLARFSVHVKADIWVFS